MASLFHNWLRKLERKLRTPRVVGGRIRTRTRPGGRDWRIEALESKALLAAAGPSILQVSSAIEVRNAPFDHIDVDFDRAIDATTFTSADVTITGPVGSSAITVNSVVSLDADSFRITFSPLTTRGTYTAAIGPNISDTLGRRMDQDKDGTAGEATDDQFRKSLAYINANVIFSAATTISETNTAFDGKDLLIDGATVAIDGPHSFNSVHVVNGGKLTHTALTTTTTHKLSLTVSQQVIIDASSSIDVTGKGYLPGRTTGNTATGASTGKSGGSYGGSGGTADGAASEIYGDYSNPQDFGSGGSGSGGTVTAGGGLVEIQATNLIVDGRIRANAESANLGSGSGGGIKITTGILSGTGFISANGGSTNSSIYGSGGGGRVAVYAADFTTFDTSTITAYGGSTGMEGAAGTVYLRDTDLAMGTLIVNAGTGGKGGTLLRVTGQATVNVADNLTLKNGAIVTARTATTSAVDKLHLIVAGTLSIDASSSIDVTGKGYLPGRTTGNTATGASTGKSGGSYGGSGGTVDGAASEIYGDYSNPQDFGSGGSGSGGTVTAGGGLVEIQATNLIVDGRIRANAESANLGSGSGGGIKITTGILSGTGTISANGGSSNAPDSGPVPGSGGGGRVAVYAADLTTFDTSKITAYGGSTGIQGAAGTVYLRDTDLNMGTLIVNAGTGGKGGTLLRVTGQATVNVADNLTLKNGAIVTARTATTSAVDKLHLIVAGTLSIDASSSIDVTGKGYLPGRTSGNTSTGASTGTSGGSYGGSGGAVDGVSNEIYGDYRNPQDFGSGGGGSGGTVTAGGGLVEIQTTNLVVDGRIRANAESANLGSGSGGGIKITTGILSGTGIISANGGSSNTPFIGNGNGSGGGGRVAVYAADFTTFDTSKITAFGGVTKGGDGAAGTVYLRDTDLALGTLAFDPGTGGKAATMLGLSTQSTVTISDNLVISHIISRPQHSGMTFSILGNLSVVNGGSITANVATTTTTDPLSLTISGTLRVDSQSTIDVSGDGYLSGRTYGNSIAGASTGFSGGSYGGFGGASLGTPNPTYGDFENPQDFGSGGGSLGGFPGGGVALIQAENIILDGRIWANGVNHGSAGSGGSVRISTRILSGAGSITANGGSTDSGAGWGSGGGGRVAVYADDFTTFDTAKITAFGGGTGVKGTPGTVYLRLLSQPLGTVIIDGGSGAGESAVIVLGRPEQSMITFDGNLIITRGIVRPEHTGMLFTVTGNLSVVNGGILSTNSATATSVDALSLVVKGSLTVDATSSIDVTGKGYLQGRTNRNTTAGASTGNSGGSFGGLGGGSSGTPNSVYGDSANPLNAGSGGANAPGGGQIDIKAGALVVNGAIRADGTGAAGGSGSGGGIKIVTGSLSGSGRISATGGATTNGTGSGGGGRVAVYSANFTSFDTSKITAAGGSTGVKGAAGSVYLAPLDAAGSTSPFGPSTELFVPLYSFPQFTDFTRTALAGWWRDIRDQATAANPITVIINPSNGTADPTNPASDFGVYRDAIRLLRQNPYVRILGYVYTQGGSRPQADVIQNIGWYQNYYLTSGGSSMVDGIFIDQLAASASQLGYYQTLAANIRGRSELAGTMIVANSGVVPEAGLLTDAIADVLVTFEDVENSAVANHTHFVDAVRPTGGSANLKYGAILHGVPTAADRDRVIRAAKIKGYSFLFVTDDVMDNPFDVKPTYWSGIPTELNRPVVPDRAVSIAENSANATVVDTIPGFDPTPGQTIAYSIVGGNVGNAFAINPTTGQLTVNNSAALDFETTPSFTLAVQVTDNGSPALSGTGTVTVQLTDVPDSSDIRVNSATTNGQSTITVNYSVLFADAPAFDLRFAKSADALFSTGDAALRTVTVSNAVDRTIGSHTLQFTIGTAAGQIPLPGTSGVDLDDDYRILVTADPTNAVAEIDVDPLNEDNTAVLSGAYLANGIVYALGRETADSLLITKTSTAYSLNFNGVATTYPLASVTSFQLRGESGADTLSAVNIDRAITLFGGAGNDILTGGTLADRIMGGAGDDTISGGAGNDIYVFNVDEAQGSDAITDASGIDTLDFSLTTAQPVSINLGLTSPQVVHASNLTLTLASATALENIIGGSGNDTLTGNTVANTLTGGDGNDLLTGGTGNDALIGGAGNDTLVGEAGNDVYVFNTNSSLGSDTLDEAGGGVDTLDFSATSTLGVTVNLSLAAAQVVNSNLTLTLGAATTFENIIGGAGTDTLTGNASANVLTGGGGNDVLDGAAGNDTYAFNAGVSLGSDTLIEAAAGGTDLLDFSTTTTAGVTVDLSLTSAQVVNSNLTLTLSAGNVFENVTGGALNDQLTGNVLANVLTGNAGNDTLMGSDGDDTLVGGVGNDSLVGGNGNDSYTFAATSALGTDTLTETTTGGIDTLNFSTTTTQVVTLDLSRTTSQVVNANLTLVLSAGDVFENATGGSLNDVLTGNSLANVLNGGAGNDTLTGGAGDDTLVGAAGNDTIAGGDGNDVYAFTATTALGADTLIESAGAGVDTLDFSTTTTFAVAVNLASAVSQVINANLALTLSAIDAFENVTGGSLADTLVGNALANVLTGGAGDDTLIGGAGNDRLVGGAGNDALTGGADDDVYVFAATSALGVDTVTELANGGVDTLDFSLATTALNVNLSSTAAQVVNAFANVTLSAGDVVENVTGGSGNDILVGNALANTLAGGLGNDTLTGAGGDDLLIGGAGNDLYLFDTDLALGNDTIDESAGGVDTLDFSATSTQTVAVNLEIATQQSVNANLRLTLGSATTFENVIGGDLNDMLTGNANANTLTGNGGDDVLTGRAGNDSLIGGAGNDRYTFAADSALGTDTLNETGGGIDTLDFSGTVSTAVTINLATATAQVVNVNLSVNLGSATNFENVIGGALGDTLTGNTLANDLNGGDGNDVLTGAAGDDVLTGGLGDDTFKFTANTALGSDTVVEVAGQGNDLLDFSTTTTQSIMLDLASSVPQVLNANLTLRLSAGDSFEMVVGTTLNDTIQGNSLNNVLFGGAGLDTLFGFGGRDLLFGGTGVDTLDGGEDDDIVVGGITTYYNESTKVLDRSAIGAIVAEWARNDIDYDARVANLRSGVGAGGAIKLTNLTLLPDGTANDSLRGGAGRDWFWKFGGDVLNDAVTGETVN